MRFILTILFTWSILQLIAQQQIPLGHWQATNPESTGEILIVTQGDTLRLNGFGQPVWDLNLDLGVVKKDQPATDLQATLTYDDGVQEAFIYAVQPDAVEDNWEIEPAYAKGRKLMSVDVSVTNGNGTIGVTGVHYTPGSAVDLTMNQTPNYIELRAVKVRQNDVLVIPYPINNPPHLADCNARTVYFTAAVASSDPQEMERGATLTAFATDYNQQFHDAFEIEVTSEPTEYSITISAERQVKNQYFLILQPAPGNPDIAIRQFRIEEGDIEHID